MRVINYREVLNHSDFIVDARKAIDDYNRSHPDYPVASGTVVFQLSHLMGALGSKNLEGKVILDLGCGSKTTRDGTGSGMFEPWLCRVLGSMGAIPVGVDASQSPGEKDFIFHEARLFRPDSFRAIHQGLYVDAANCYSLLDSPEVCQGVVGSAEELTEQLADQLELIVRPEGFFLYSHYGEIANAGRMR